MAKIKDLEAKFARTEEQVRLFQKISRLMARDLSLQDVLQHIIGLVNDFMHCDSCLIYLMDGHDLVLCAASNAAPNTIGQVRLKIGEGLTGWVAKERRFVAISREAYLDPRFKRFSDLPEDTYEAFLSAPVIARNKVVGVLNVQHRAPHSFSGLEMELLTTVGEQIGCLLLLSRMPASAILEANHAALALAPAMAALTPRT